MGHCAPHEVFDEGVRLHRPLSPHLAARLGGQSIALDSLVDLVRNDPVSTRWIIEGAGGVLVPINGSELMVDLMIRVSLPVLVVARTALGTINHTLLTIEALRARSIVVAGVLMVGGKNTENREAIETYGRVRVVGELPFLDPLTPDALKQSALENLSNLLNV